MWSYDERGDRTSEATRESAPAVAVSWTYDRADRMTSRSADGVTVSYAYDAAGDLISASGPTGTISIEVDALGRPTEVTPDDGSTLTEYTYGLLSEDRDDVTGSYSADLDAFGRETSLTTPLHASAFTFTWRPDGRLKTRSDPNGMSHASSYAAGRLTNITSTGSGCSGSSCAELTYTYDRAGMRLSEASSIDNDPANGTAAFTYDALGRIVTDDAPGSVPDQAYDWAAVLDREAKTVGATTVTTSFDAADRPVSDSGGGSYDHDLDGRLTAKPGQALEWDSLGRLVRVRDGSGAVLSAYTYDALDRLREVSSGGTTIRHRYVGTTTRLAQLWNVSTTSSDRNLSWSVGGTLLGDLKPGLSGRRYFGTNAHGDLAWSANASAAVNASLRLDPWGTAIGSAGDIGQLRFQGSWRDPATGLSWIISRWYAPELGAFVSEDSLLGEPVNPASRHLRAYGLGDPVGMVDVDGRAIPILNDLLACLSAFSVGGCLLGIELKFRAENEAKERRHGEKYAGPGRKDGERDALRHCLIAGYLTCALGTNTAKQMLMWHEFMEPQDTPRQKARQAMEQHNDKVGIAVGKTARRHFPLTWEEQVLVWSFNVNGYNRRLHFVERRCQARSKEGGLWWMTGWGPYIWLTSARGYIGYFGRR